MSPHGMFFFFFFFFFFVPGFVFLLYRVAFAPLG